MLDEGRNWWLQEIANTSLLGAASPNALLTCLFLIAVLCAKVPARPQRPTAPPLGTALVPVHVDLADLLTSRGGAAMPWPLSFSFCIITVSTFSPNTLELPRQRGAAGEPCGCCGVRLSAARQHWARQRYFIGQQAQAASTLVLCSAFCRGRLLAGRLSPPSPCCFMLALSVSCQPDQAVPVPQGRVLWAWQHIRDSNPFPQSASLALHQQPTKLWSHFSSQGFRGYSRWLPEGTQSPPGAQAVQAAGITVTQ